MDFDQPCIDTLLDGLEELIRFLVTFISFSMSPSYKDYKSAIFRTGGSILTKLAKIYCKERVKS